MEESIAGNRASGPGDRWHAVRASDLTGDEKTSVPFPDEKTSMPLAERR